MTRTIIERASARFGHRVRGVALVAAATALLLVGKPAFALGSASVAPSPSRAVSPTNAQPQPTRMRSAPILALGVAVSGMGLVLIQIGFVQGLRQSLCASGSWSLDDPDGGETDCESGAGDLVSGGGLLVLAGVPLIFVGAQRVPAKPTLRATLVPMPVARGAGLGIRLEL